MLADRAAVTHLPYKMFRYDNADFVYNIELLLHYVGNNYKGLADSHAVCQKRMLPSLSCAAFVRSFRGYNAEIVSASAEFPRIKFSLTLVKSSSITNQNLSF